MRRREQEVLVAEVGLEVAGGDEVLELLLDLGVGQAVRDRAFTGHWLGGYGSVSSSTPPKVTAYRANAPVRSLYWADDRVDVLMAAAVVGQVLEVLLQTRRHSRAG